MPELLIELFSEEIPARMQTRAASDLQTRVCDGLREAGLEFKAAQSFSTPRRLTLVIEDLASESPTSSEERKGPRVDAPEKAIEGFLRGAGLTRDDLEVRDDKKGQVFFAKITKPGRTAEEIVAVVLPDVVRNFPWPKSMRWGQGSLRWVRPLHSILCLLSDDGDTRVVAMDLDGITSGNTTEGHRFMAPGRFEVSSFVDYSDKLHKAYVMLDANARAELIEEQAKALASEAGLELVEDAGLLREVAGLGEWPVPLMGEIGAEFLDLPPEVLQTSMREHQKFFSVRDAKSSRIERFITVANRETADNGATILAGNQKVLAARLADAKFFWENDLRVAKSGMDPWTEALANVTFHNKLGSQADRIERIAALAKELAPVVDADPDLAEQAALVAKADLSSEMVYEFPELQGVMGRYYAAEAGLPAEVAATCEEHYAPLGPSDDVPTAPVSVAVALADKLDTLTGFWAIDEKPTGSKDPFALRRAALGVIRLVLENKVQLELNDAIYASNSIRVDQVLRKEREELVEEFARLQESAAQFQDLLNMVAQKRKSSYLGYITQFLEERASVFDEEKSRDEQVSHAIDYIIEKRANMDFGAFDRRTLDLPNFFHDRLKIFLRDQGVRHDVIDACIAMEGNDDLALLVKRARALQEVLSTEDGENLVQGFKRANNILTQAEEKDGVEYSYGPDAKFAEGPEEKALFMALDEAEESIKTALDSQDFASAMTSMAALRAPVDAFFEAVQINTDSEITRRNRLNLLHKIRSICLQSADLTRLEG
ncbi:MAG: glycine--tRNA ligase subunit beta [Pseudomonadota bacterium]